MKIRLLLNSGISGPHAWFCLAQERGYFHDAGLDIDFVGGEGAAAVVPLIGDEGFEAGYGDLNALAELAAFRPEAAPVAVFSMFNTPPFTIAVRADSHIHSAEDLAGAVLAGHAQDAALKLFPALADAARIDPASVRITPSSVGLGVMVRDLLLTGRTDGVFGFVNTIIAAIAPLDLDPSRLRFINFSDTVPDLYSNSLMVSRAFIARAPEQVRALVLGVNRGLVDTLADIDAGIDAVVRAGASVNREVQLRRLLGTLRAEMANAEGARIGIGDVDDARLQRGIALLARTCGWPRQPLASDIFTRVFLPALDQRVRTLAR